MPFRRNHLENDGFQTACRKPVEIFCCAR
jgi:hypothetical protein